MTPALVAHDPLSNPLPGVIESHNTWIRNWVSLHIDESGGMLDAWFWWYQASDGELVICGQHAEARPQGDSDAVLRRRSTTRGH
ncbi:MAG: hypothetical protein ACI83Y_002674 [Candidatus Azotimanducaceae bacterium]|jgi:hypothetical protein